MNASDAKANYGTYEGSYSMPQIIPLIHRCFDGKRLLISAFDSGPITPQKEEIELGWTSVTGGMLSPPIKPDIDFPSAEYDEWWVFETADAAAKMPDYDQFVNYGSWTLRSPKEMTKDYDPTWEKTAWDWIVPHQDRFWDMIECFRPLAYLCDGGRFVAVSSDLSFIAGLGNENTIVEQTAT